MLILGIETATEKVSSRSEATRACSGCSRWRGGDGLESLTPAIEFVCSQADVTLGEFGAVHEVDVGPGLFTGMRVGIAAAKAMAHALRVPVIPVASLDLLALPLRYADRLIAAVIDARRSEVYYRVLPAGPRWRAAAREAGGRLGRRPGGGVPGHRRGGPPGGRRHAAATGSRSAPASAASTSPSSGWPSPEHAAPLVQLAHARALREEWVQPGEVQPLYLRRPDAEINWVTRESAQVGVVKILPERPSSPRDKTYPCVRVKPGCAAAMCGPS